MIAVKRRQAEKVELERKDNGEGFSPPHLQEVKPEATQAERYYHLACGSQVVRKWTSEKDAQGNEKTYWLWECPKCLCAPVDTELMDESQREAWNEARITALEEKTKRQDERLKRLEELLHEGGTFHVE